MVLASAVEPLRASRALSVETELEWYLATMDGQPAKSSSGLVLQPDCALSDIGTCDALFVICGYGARGHTQPATLAKLTAAAQQARIIGGLDVGAWLLASADLLNDRKATIHWQEMEAFEEEFLHVIVQNNRYVIDQDRITAGGATAVMDLMLHLIRQNIGEATAFDVSNLFIYDSESSMRAERGARSQGIAIRAPQLKKAIEEMRKRVEEPCSLTTIADLVAVSPKTLERQFKRELGVAPGRYFQMIRLNRARAMAEETDSKVTEIATRTGFSSAASLSRAFSAYFNISISAIRRRRNR